MQDTHQPAGGKFHLFRFFSYTGCIVLLAASRLTEMILAHLIMNVFSIYDIGPIYDSFGIPKIFAYFLFPFLLDIFNPGYVFAGLGIIQTIGAFVMNSAKTVSVAKFAYVLLYLFQISSYAATFKLVSLWFTKRKTGIAFGCLIVCGDFAFAIVETILIVTSNTIKIALVCGIVYIIGIVFVAIGAVPKSRGLNPLNETEETNGIADAFKNFFVQLIKALKSYNFYALLIFSIMAMFLYNDLIITVRQLRPVDWLVTWGFGLFLGCIILPLIHLGCQFKYYATVFTTILFATTIALLFCKDTLTQGTSAIFQIVLGIFTLPQICIAYRIIAEQFSLSITGFVVGLITALGSIIILIVEKAIPFDPNFSNPDPKIVKTRFGVGIGLSLVMLISSIFLVRKDEENKEFASNNATTTPLV